jgi:signal transduction histidine kinase
MVGHAALPRKIPASRYAARVSPFGTLLLVCAALYAQAAVLYGWLWFYRSRTDPLTRGMLGTAVGATLFAAGALLLTAPVSRVLAEVGARLLYAGSFVAVTSFLLAAASVAGFQIPPSWVRGVVGVGALCTALALLGLVHDPASVSAGMAHEPRLRVAGVMLLGVAVLAMAAALGLLAWGASRRAGARWLLLGASPGVVAALVEQIARTQGHEPAFALTVAGTVLMMVASWVLLRRFAAVGDRLREERQALEASHAALVRTQRERARAEQLAGLGELSVALAGEISRPMVALRRSAAQLDRATVESGRARPILDEIDHETRHLNQLVGDLLVFARPLQEERRPLRVGVLVEDAIRDLAAQQKRSLPIHVEATPELDVLCEPEALRRALVHVLENAVAASGDEPVTVHARPLGDREAVIEIHDSGEGMDTVVRKRALEPFFTTRPYGTGLGLAIVARVLRAHGGSVTIDSAPGRGATVRLVLPLADKG